MPRQIAYSRLPFGVPLNQTNEVLEECRAEVKAVWAEREVVRADGATVIPPKLNGRSILEDLLDVERWCPVGDISARDSRYRLAFSVGGLFSQEAMIAAPLFLQSDSWQVVRSQIDADNLLQARTVASGRRRSRELVHRLAELTAEELKLLLDSTATERGYLMWSAACRRYDLVGEFAEEVVRERFLVLAPTLKPEHFESFLRGKSVWHEELYSLTESTRRKLRTTVYLMLREAGLLSVSGEILRCLLSPRLTAVFDKRTPSDLRFFPVTVDIAREAR